MSRKDDDRKLKQAGRLALRQEGKMWNAYFALPDSMNEAVFLGSIAMAAVVGNDDRKRAFMRIMSEFVADILEEKVGVRPEYMQPQPAPEHERSGHS